MSIKQYKKIEFTSQTLSINRLSTICLCFTHVYTVAYGFIILTQHFLKSFKWLQFFFNRIGLNAQLFNFERYCNRISTQRWKKGSEFFLLLLYWLHSGISFILLPKARPTTSNPLFQRPACWLFIQMTSKLLLKS